MIILTIERMTIRKTLSQEINALVDTLCGGRFVFKPYIHAMPEIDHRSATRAKQKNKLEGSWMRPEDPDVH